MISMLVFSDVSGGGCGHVIFTPGLEKKGKCGAWRSTVDHPEHGCSLSRHKEHLCKTFICALVHY